MIKVSRRPKPAATIDRYFQELAQDPRALTSYRSSQLWTPIATRALVATGLAAYPEGEPTAKGNRNRYGGSEYLTLDVCICPSTNWGTPLFAAEHENYVGREKVQYCAWKLLSTCAKTRMLVAYFGAKTSLPTFADLRNSVAEVCHDSPGEQVILLGADYREKPKSHEDLRRIHRHDVVG